jgi:STAS-like domain of unknown function (DUF4325)
MTEMTFSIAKSFSLSPGPRYSRQGPDSGEALRRLLARKLNSIQGSIRIILDGTRGYGSSFLDEAFGGLIRSEQISREEVLSRLEFVSEMDPSYIDEIMESINKAVPETVTGQ